jgi:hypothetical protein
MVTFRRFVLPLLAVLLCCRFVIAAPTDLTGVWSGSYSYPAESQNAPVKFTLLLLRAENGYCGCVVEPNTFGKERQEPFLHADLLGARFDESSRTLTFTKKYDGTDGIDHNVEYSGRLSANGTGMNGTWTIPGAWSGAFSIAKSANTGSGRFSSGMWIGEYRYSEGAVDQAGNAMQPVPFRMFIVHNGDALWGYVHEPKTFGEGHSPGLHATLEGRFDSTTKRVSFTKTYDGTGGVRHAVEYQGQVSEDDTITGTWEIPNHNRGTFTANLSHKP